MTQKMRRHVISLSGLVLLIAAIGRPTAAQADRTALLTEIETTWRAGDFTRLGQLCQNYLGGVLDPDGATAAFPLAGLAASEIIAGRNADAFGHLRKAFTNLIQDSCRKGIPLFQPAYLTAMMLLSAAPMNKSPLFQAVMKDLIDSLESSPPAPKDYSEMTRGVIIVIASNLASRCLEDGDLSGARVYADKAMALVPPVEPDKKTLWGDFTCGCIPFKYSKIARGDFSIHATDEIVRGHRISCYHPQRGAALFAAIAVDLRSGDTSRLRRTAFALEDLLDRSAPTGSLRDNGQLRGMLELTLNSVRRSFPGLWPAPAVPRSLSLADVESNPVLGKGRAVVRTKKYKESDGLLKGTWFSVEIEAQVPSSEAGRLPEGTWWVYRLEDGQLRAAGQVECFRDTPPKRAGTMLNFSSVRGLTTGPTESANWHLEYKKDAKIKAAALVEALTPCYVSRELIGLDFEGIPPHRLDLFQEGIPWVGMSTRLLRLNLRKSLVEGSRSFYEFLELESRSSAGEEIMINSVFCDIKTRDGKVSGIKARER